MAKPDDLCVSDKVIKNTSYNAIGRIWFGVIGVFLTPYIIGRIGVDRFAIWALVSVLTNYFALLDFGVGSSFVKYISEFYTQKDYPRINKLLNTGFGFYFVFALVIIAGTLIFLDPLLSFMKVSALYYSEAKFVFLLGISVFCVSNAIGTFISIPSGLQRMDIPNTIAIAVSCLNMAGTIFFLERGMGLRGLMINNALTFAVSSMLSIVAAYKLLPQLKFMPFAWDPGMFKRIFSFGFRVQVSRISGTIIGQTDKLLIAYFLAIGFVTYYQLGNGVVNYVMAVPALLIS
ncbi:MAG: hypothetical protein MUC52_03620, partial [Candidatus Omnitrophica bacterium]|nr:hypothetical protein [Candidatus Omnitrophota bacterium]